jgi:hypothetical protein
MRKLSLDNDLDETIWIEIRNILTIIQQRVPSLLNIAHTCWPVAYIFYTFKHSVNYH